MAQTTSLVFNGGVIPSPSPAAGSGKAKLLKIGEITIVEQEAQVTKKVICDPDSITTVAPFMEVLTPARLAELISANSILVLDDGTVQYLMADATVVVEDGTSVCTSVSFLGLSLEDRAKVLYPCTRITDELTLQQVLEVGEPVETGFDLVKAYPEDTEAGTLIDKLEIKDNSTDPDWQPLLEVVQGDHKVAINEDNLREAILGINENIDGIIETIHEMDVDSVPHAYLNSTLNQSAGDSTTTRTTVDVFAYSALVGDCFEFEQTTTIDDTPFGYVWIEPGTYLINAAVTLQWVGNPRGTFIAKVGSVMGENFDFSQEQEIKRNTTKVVTIPNRMKLSINITYDAGTPVMGFWIQSMQVVKLAGGMSQTTVAHGLSLEGNGSVEDPLDISEHGLQGAFDYAKNKNYFATKQEIAPLATKSALQAETARATQRENEIEALFVLPTQEAVDAWLDSHPEATTTVQDHSLTGNKLVLGTLNFVTPEMFGAVGDGVTDDSVAIAAMLENGNVCCLFKRGATYKISSPIRYYSNTLIDLNGCTVHSTHKGHIFTNNAILVENVCFRNGAIESEAVNNDVGDQAAAILAFSANNIIIENIRTNNTFGDGFTLRFAQNVFIRNCSINNFGRNGISPTSGSFIIEDVTIGTALAGANPGNPFDCEPNTATESASFVIRRVKAPRMTFVDFRTEADGDFLITADLEDVVMTGGYPGLYVKSSNAVSAKNFVLRNCTLTRISDGHGIKIENVSGVVIDSCKFQSLSTQSQAICLVGSVSFTLRNVDLTGWHRALFVYNASLDSALIDNCKLSIYCNRDFKNNRIVGSDISSFEFVGAGVTTGNLVFASTIPLTLKALLPMYGNSKGQLFGSAVLSGEESYDVPYTDTLTFKVPLPTDDNTKGRCYLVSLGFSHRGRVNLSCVKLIQVLVEDNNTIHINDVSSYGDRAMTISADTVNRALNVECSVAYDGIFSYAVLG